jgi:single-stranded-DNA-specific exonuclease
MLDEAITKVEHLDDIPPVLVLAGEEWHEGVVGIVASRLVERYHRPAILLGIRDGVAKGSGRSIPAYDLMCGLNAVGVLDGLWRSPPSCGLDIGCCQSW